MSYNRQQLVLFFIFFGSLTFMLAGCDDKQSQTPPLASVSYMPIKPQTVTLLTELSGRTSPFMVSEVRPQVSGIIQERLFTEGAEVKQGDVLYQIDPSLYQAAYDNAKATLMKAEANERAAQLLAERYQKVVRVKAVSKQEYDNAVAAQGQAKAEVAAAKAALDTARINLDYTKVTAPVSGIIGRSSITPGALVTQNQGTPLATIQQLDPIYVDVTQSSSDLLRLKRALASGALKTSTEAMEVRLKLEDGTPYSTGEKEPQKDPVTGQILKDSEGNILYEPKPVIGTLKFSEVTVEQSTGVVTLRAVFPNPDGILLPGMYVRAILAEGVKENAILIPQKAVVRNNRGLPVAQVLSRKPDSQAPQDVFDVNARILTVDRPIGNMWLVTDGLKEGEFLLTEGLMKVRAGVPVRGELDTGNAPSKTDGDVNASAAKTNGQ